MGTDTDSNKSLNEATEKALRLNVSMDSTADVSMSSPDKRCVQESSTREEGMLDVGGGERHRPQLVMRDGGGGGDAGCGWRGTS